MTFDALPFRPRAPIPPVHEKWNELQRAYGPPERVTQDNPYPFNSEHWRIWQQGADATNEKWRAAWLAKLPAEKREARG